MAITAGHVRVTVRGLFEGQRFENVQWYRTDGAAFLTADAVGVGEAFWNDIKSVWRAALAAASSLTTQSILVSEPGSSGAFGEFAVPAGEQQGTRAGGGSEFLPTFNSAGIRLTVATRLTRPGQKRFVGGLEVDQAGGVWQAAYQTLLNAVAVKFSEPITLGAPVATGVLIPEIVRLNPTSGAIDAAQDVTGYVLNTRVTSQVSRKIGRGI